MSLSNRNIVILSHAKFDSPVESTGYTIAKYLAQNNSVFYVEHPFTWKDYFRFRGTAEFERRSGHFFNSEQLVATSVPKLKVVICPPVLSINFLPEGWLYRKLLKINEWIVSSRIKKVIKQWDLDDVIYINIFNFHFPGIAERFKPSLQVYYCVDPMITPYDIRHGIISEEELVRNSGLVICTSRNLQEEKLKQNPETYFIANAADIHHSSKAMDEQLSVHPAISMLKKPIIGYFGHIERRMDFSLLREVILLNPDKSFVFAGPVSEGFGAESIQSIANVHFTGRIPYDEMPAMVKGFDVAIIPFKKDHVSRTIFPLKLFEYLGAGKAVVCTDFNPDLAEFTEDTVLYCGDARSFSDALAQSLLQNTSVVQKRLAIASANTWDMRIKEISGLLGKFS